MDKYHLLLTWCENRGNSGCAIHPVIWIKQPFKWSLNLIFAFCYFFKTNIDLSWTPLVCWHKVMVVHSIHLQCRMNTWLSAYGFSAEEVLKETNPCIKFISQDEWGSFDREWETQSWSLFSLDWAEGPGLSGTLSSVTKWWRKAVLQVNDDYEDETWCAQTEVICSWWETNNVF